MSELSAIASQPSTAPGGLLNEAPPLCGRRLLVVDDEEVICQIVQGFLGVEGWEVDSVAGTEAAYARFTTDRYPVVLCDVHLPGDSTDLLRRLKAHSPATQVIMFTGDPTVSTVREALLHGAYEYVSKPC
jgi:two-component system, NtrC family, response regulator HydG